MAGSKGTTVDIETALRSLQDKNNMNRQARRSKEWMLQALLLLMEEMPYEKITVSHIARKAGVARQTFYRNYASKDDIIIQYLDNILSIHFVKAASIRDKKGRDTLILTFSFQSFLEHKQRLAQLWRNGDERLFFIHVQKWEDYVIDLGKNTVSEKEKLLFRYVVKFQIGGALRMLSDWMKQDLPISAEIMAKLLEKFSAAIRTDFGGVPKLVIRVQNEAEDPK
ncbi:MAG: TetR/AcrR family transcriptional regulator [Spirochaetales bacterium]|jgi:AcrR family transcriptional regulator|nr:TetR/AcrR family transcriptional regulator [Spirochaetales bacterium]